MRPRSSRVWFYLDRQHQPCRGALAFGALQLEATAVELGDGAHQVQAQAQARGLAHVAAPEVAGGDVLELIGGDALALVRHLQVEPPLQNLGPQVYGAVRGGVFEGVIQEVQQGRAQ